MSRCGLLAVSLFALLLTGIVLAHSGRADDDPRTPRSPHSLSGDTALRYRQAQPRHWRAYLLQH